MATGSTILPSKARIERLVDQRLGFFSAPIQASIRAIIAEGGGVKAMHLAFHDKADQRRQDGGELDWKLGDPTGPVDYENAHGHIHLSLKAGSRRKIDAR